MTESTFVKHLPCPKCGPIQDRSGNNLGLYSDGHKWCFACGYWEPSDRGVSVEEAMAIVFEKEHKDKNDNTVLLPSDSTHILPSSALEWLRKYEISDDEIHKNKILWSPSHQRLIIPIFDGEGNLLMWQGRYFPDAATGYVNKHKPRYYTRGKPEHIDAYFGHLESAQESCVVVEDFVSAIKVSRVMPTLCLWGSELSLARIRRIAWKYKNLYIWLDYDKARHSLKCQLKASPYFDMVSHVFTVNDPKEYPMSRIRQCLGVQ